MRHEQSGEEPSARQVEPGTLYVVATPIGNLGDLSVRARTVLEQVDCIAAEDTRMTRRLFPGGAPRARLLALHAHNERAQLARIVEQLREGGSVALVSDAGTPGISDPGSRLVDAAHEAGLPVRALPGPSAVMAALSVCGLDIARFTFCGFLPAARAARRRALTALEAVPGALVLLEAPHRVCESVIDLAEVLGGERRVAIARELTKRFESVHRCPLAAAADWLAGDPDRVRGEFVLVVEADRTPATGDEALAKRLADALVGELPTARAASVIARVTGVDREQAWCLALAARSG